MLKGKMVKSGEKVAVALGGGKDSSVVLYILNKLLGDQVELFAITIDEGIKGYWDDTVKSAHRIADNLGIEHETMSFPYKYGLRPGSSRARR
ncbi:MAG: asparagine synthase-related protein [Methanotrichaceae archaeon]|nr:asparagine synthase-related protein [Methanotrichaceae archaeon]